MEIPCRPVMKYINVPKAQEENAEIEWTLVPNLVKSIDSFRYYTFKLKIIYVYELWNWGSSIVENNFLLSFNKIFITLFMWGLILDAYPVAE